MKTSTIKKDILEDTLKEFSNRLLPKADVTSPLWCPQCYLEWMVRKLAGLGYAPGADPRKSELIIFQLDSATPYIPQVSEEINGIFYS
jgi:hypothetical protein